MEDRGVAITLVAAVTAVTAVAAAVCTEDEAGEEDHRDDEDHAGDDPDPCRRGGESGPAGRLGLVDRLDRGLRRRRCRGDGAGRGFGRGRRCFTHRHDLAGRSDVPVMYHL